MLLSIAKFLIQKPNIISSDIIDKIQIDSRINLLDILYEIKDNYYDELKNKIKNYKAINTDILNKPLEFSSSVFETMKELVDSTALDMFSCSVTTCPFYCFLDGISKEQINIIIKKNVNFLTINHDYIEKDPDVRAKTAIASENFVYTKDYYINIEIENNLNELKIIMENLKTELEDKQKTLIINDNKEKELINDLQNKIKNLEVSIENQLNRKEFYKDKNQVVRFCIVGDLYNLDSEFTNSNILTWYKLKTLLIPIVKNQFKMHVEYVLLKEIIENAEYDYMQKTINKLDKAYYKFITSLYNELTKPIEVEKNSIENIFENINEKIKYYSSILNGGFKFLIQCLIYENEEIIESYWVNCGDNLLYSIEFHTENNETYFMVNLRNLPETNDTISLAFHYNSFNYFLKDNQNKITKPGYILDYYSSVGFNSDCYGLYNNIKCTSGFYIKKDSNTKVMAFILGLNKIPLKLKNELNISHAFLNAFNTIYKLKDAHIKIISYAFFLYFLEKLLENNNSQKDKTNRISLIINADNDELNKLKNKVNGFKLFMVEFNVDDNKTHKIFKSYFKNNKFKSNMLNLMNNIKNTTNNIYLYMDFDEKKLKNIENLIQQNQNKLDELSNKKKYYEKLNFSVIYNILKSVFICNFDIMKSNIKNNKISILTLLYMYYYILSNKLNIIIDFNYYYLSDNICFKYYEKYKEGIISNKDINKNFVNKPNLIFPIPNQKQDQISFSDYFNKLNPFVILSYFRNNYTFQDNGARIINKIDKNIFVFNQLIDILKSNDASEYCFLNNLKNPSMKKKLFDPCFKPYINYDNNGDLIVTNELKRKASQYVKLFILQFLYCITNFDNVFECREDLKKFFSNYNASESKLI